MGSILKYLAYALLIAFAASWVMVVYKSCNETKEPIILSSIEDGKAALSDAATTTKGKVIGDLMEEDEEDQDYGDGEDDLEELDEDEILAEDWDEDDEEEDEDEDEEVEEIAEEKEEPAPAKKKETKSYEKVVTTSSNGKYLVIGGSFSTKGNANTFVKQLSKLGYEDAEVVVFDRSKKYHTVSVARFDSKTDASKLVGALKSKGIPDAYVHKKRG